MANISDPIKIGNLELKNRLVAAPMVINMATEQGFATERQIGFYERKAAGGYGLVHIEASHILSDDRTFPKMLGIHSNLSKPGLVAITEVIHRQGAKCSIQIQHPGRQGQYSLNYVDLLAPSETTPSWLGQPTRPITFKECKEIIQAFAIAATRAKQFGFDTVMIHGAHGFLLQQFMSPFTNQRKDHYGNPLAFVTEVIQAVKAAVGDHFPVMIRVSGDEFLGGKGYNIDQFCEMAPKLVEAGADAIDVSAAVFETYDRMFPCMYHRRGCNVYLAQKIKQVVDVPVCTVGRVNDPKLARSIIETGKADLVAVGRQQLADPDFAIKTLRGDDDEIRQCIACDWCTDRLMNRIHVQCAVNYFFTRERRFDERNLYPSPIKKRVVVIGGGVAGMEAARVAGLRGHDVTVVEKSPQLGGLVDSVASRVPRLNTREVANITRYLKRQLDKIPNVKISLGKEATKEAISQMKPDIVLIATGSLPVKPAVPGANNSNVITIDDYLSKGLPVGDKVLIIGGENGAEIAVSLAREGKKVTIVESSSEIATAPYITPIASRRNVLLGFIKSEQVDVKTEYQLKEINNNGVIILDKNKKEAKFEADTVIIAGERASNVSLAEELRGSVDQIYKIGDCVQPRNIYSAIHDAASRALMI